VDYYIDSSAKNEQNNEETLIYTWHQHCILAKSSDMPLAAGTVGQGKGLYTIHQKRRKAVGRDRAFQATTQETGGITSGVDNKGNRKANNDRRLCLP
jgi:hypothetical protein